jgi:hypothetical protein
MKIIIKIFLVFCVIGLLTESPAQFTKKAQVGFRFLENPVSAEVVGRGMIGVVNTASANAIFWNPSQLAFVEKDYEIALNHTRGIADINYNAIGAAINLFDFGVLGFSLLAMDYGVFYTTVRAANEQGYIETGEFSPTAFAAGASFSQRITNRFSYGVHLKYVRQNLGEAWVSTAGDSLNDPNLTLKKRKYEQGTLALDVGAYYDFLFNGIKFGAVLQNISRELKYENEQFPLPFAISFGITVEPLQLFYGDDPVHSLVLGFESRHPRDFGEKVKFGAEYCFSNLFIARFGYLMNYDERNWTAGVGVRQEVSGVPLKVDYAFQPFGILGDVHYISIGVAY